jgi:DNA polymerase-1
MSEAKQLIQAFVEDADIHRRTAALIFNKAEDEISDDQRRAAKTINFGIIYGQSAFGLSKTLKISRTEAQSFITNYFKSYPQIQDYLKNMVEEAKKNSYVETLTGRKRFITDIHSKNPALRQFAERIAVNSPLQGTAADLMKAAMISAYNFIESSGLKSRFLLQVHDELIFESPKEEVNVLKDSIIKIMEDTRILSGFGVKEFKVKMKAEFAQGNDWGEI